jgi:hypothetical protein
MNKKQTRSVLGNMLPLNTRLRVIDIYIVDFPTLLTLIFIIYLHYLYLSLPIFD